MSASPMQCAAAWQSHCEHQRYLMLYSVMIRNPPMLTNVRLRSTGNVEMLSRREIFGPIPGSVC